MNKGTELIVLENVKTDVLFHQDGLLDAVVDGIKVKANDFEPDTDTDEGRKKIASMSRKVSSSKVFLDNLRKDIIAKEEPKIESAKAKLDSAEKDYKSAKSKVKDANTRWKPIEERLNSLRDEVRKPLTDHEAEETRKEDAQKAEIRGKIDGFKALFSGLNGTGTVEQLDAVIFELEAVEITPEVFFGATTEAEETIAELLTRARQDRETRIRLDADETARKAESDRLKKVAEEQAESAKKLKEQQDKIDAANLKIKADKDAIEAEKKKADAKRAGLRLKELKGVTYDGEMVKDSKGPNVLFTHNNLINFSDSEFEAIAKPHNELVAERSKAKAEQAKKDQAALELKAKVKADTEAKEAVAQAERDRIAKEAKEAAEEARLEALKPDFEKIMYFSQFLSKGMNFPEVESETAKNILFYAVTKLNDLSVDLAEKAQSM